MSEQDEKIVTLPVVRVETARPATGKPGAREVAQRLIATAEAHMDGSEYSRMSHENAVELLAALKALYALNPLTTDDAFPNSQPHSVAGDEIDRLALRIAQAIDAGELAEAGTIPTIAKSIIIGRLLASASPAPTNSAGDTAVRAAALLRWIENNAIEVCRAIRFNHSTEMSRKFADLEMAARGTARALHSPVAVAGDRGAVLEEAAIELDNAAYVEECADDTLAGTRRGKPWRDAAARVRAIKERP